MKNLFKNLMLVAVAAMAFTACTESNNEVDAVSKTTRFEFTANIAEETRSGFAEKEEGATAYKSEWFGNETLKLFVTDYQGYYVETTASINAEGKFDLELTDAPESFFISVCSPAESWASESSYTIPAEQTPLANSVDPKAHLLQSSPMPVSGGQASINLNHMAAYGKMTLKGVDFAIDHVVVDLKGSFYSYDREYSYTINADNVENNTFWFATEPIDVAEFTVTAFDAESNAVTKTVDVAEAGKTMSFQYGRVGTFSVSGLEEYVAFTRAYTGEYTSSYNDYYIWFEGPAGKLKTNPCYITTPDWELMPGTYNVQAGGQCFYRGSYTALNDQYSDGGTVTVSVVNGMYHFDFNIILANGTVFTESYTGLVEGLNVPDMRTPLEMPNVTANVEGNIITLSWDPVDGAESYLVSCEVGGLEAISTSETSVPIEADYLKNYTFKVQAVASDSDPNFKSSNDCYVEVTTEADPNQVIPEFTTMTYVGTEDTYLENGEYCHVFELTSSDNYKMNLYVGSYQASSTHIDVGEYHYEGKMNLGYENAQWGFQAKVWNSDGSYLGITSQYSKMVVKKSGDIYNIDFTLIIDGNTHFFVCNAAIGGNEPAPAPDPEPDPEPEPTPDPDQPDPDQPGDGSVVFSSCTYLENVYGMLKHYKFVSADGNNIVHVFMRSNISGTSTNYIPVGDYTNASMNVTAQNLSNFNMDCNAGASIADTKINGVSYANGISTDASNTMSVKEASNGGNHEIEFNIKGVTYRFSGTIQ